MTGKTSLIGAAALLITAPVLGGSHSWDINEIFSDSSGTIQFIELKECCDNSGENFINNLPVSSNLNTFLFPGNIAGDTGLRHLLLGTAAYAATPGAATPDYIITEDFFDLVADFLEYHTYDDFVFSAGDLPLNGKLSLNRLGPGPTNHGSNHNSPTNYAGQSGRIDVCPWDTNGDGFVDTVDFLDLLARWGTNPPGPPDFNGDLNVDTIDFLELLANWGPC